MAPKVQVTLGEPEEEPKVGSAPAEKGADAPKKPESPAEGNGAKRRKLTTTIPDLQPSDWFRHRLSEWQKELAKWHSKHLNHKDPSASPAPVVAATSKASAPPPAFGADKAAEEKKEEEKRQKKKEEEEEKKKQKEKEDEDKDPMLLLEEEMDREECADIFGLEDILDAPADSGTPLSSNFVFEDWALLSLRFEIHLLVHAFRRDASKKHPDLAGISSEHVAHYYNKYYKKALNPKSYGVESVGALLELVKDTVVLGVRNDVVESMVSDDLNSNDIFVMLTEESRRDRSRRVDAGDKKADIKFAKPSPGSWFARVEPIAPKPLVGATSTMSGLAATAKSVAFSKNGSPSVTVSDTAMKGASMSKAAPSWLAATPKSGGAAENGGGYDKGGSKGFGKDGKGIMAMPSMESFGKAPSMGKGWDDWGVPKAGGKGGKGGKGGDDGWGGDGGWGVPKAGGKGDGGKGGWGGGKSWGKGW